MRYIKILLIIIVFSLQFLPTKTQNETDNLEIKKTKTPPKLNMKQSILLNQVIAAYALDGSKNILCKNHTRKYKEAIRLFEPWAMKMLDASSKLQPGVLSGNTGEFGSYDQCLQTHTLTEYGEIRGQMCAVDLIPGPRLSGHIIRIRGLPQNKEEWILNTLTFNSLWTICLPDSCPYDDVQTHLNRTIQSMADGLDLEVKIAEDGCVSKKNERNITNNATKTQWITFILIACIIIFVVICTVYELCINYYKMKGNQALLIFSAYSNAKIILSEKAENEKLSCLDGIRSLSIMWVILGHRYFLTMYVPIVNGLDILDWMNTIPSALILGGTVSVDTFFMMSGLLLAYLYFSAMNKGVKFNLILFYLRRYVRVSAPLVIVVLFYSHLLEFLGAGPVWTRTMHGLRDPCQEYWWSTMLHIQNYINPTKFCIIQTWYLSCDMQYYFMAPMIIYPVWKWTHFGIFLFFIWLVVAILYSFEVGWVNEFNGGMPVTNELTSTPYWAKQYIASTARISPYLLGLAFGYILYLTKDKKIKFNPALKTLGWILSLGTITAVVFGCLPFESLYHDYNRMESTIYLAFSRPAWTIALAWIVFNCVHDMAGPINTFLSLYVFKVIAKLSYCMFLTHIAITFSKNGAEKVSFHFSNFEMYFFFFGDLAFTLLFSTILSLCVEIPIMKIDTMLRKKVMPAKKVDPK